MDQHNLSARLAGQARCLCQSRLAESRAVKRHQNTTEWLLGNDLSYRNQQDGASSAL